jgi:hypothetical protein
MTPVNTEFLSRFLQLGQFESCIKRWRFQDPGQYTIAFSAGTTLETPKISVTAGGKSLTVVLR